MKYLKTYEEKTELLKIGDYVICKEILMSHYYFAEKLNDFLTQNVGQYISDVRNGMYLVQYENIPEELKKYFNEDEKIENSRPMEKREILQWSIDKEYLEAMIAAKRYNL